MLRVLMGVSVAGLLWAAATDSTGARPVRCQLPARAQQLVNAPSLVLWGVRHRVEYGYHEFRLTACLRRTGRRTPLGSADANARSFRHGVRTAADYLVFYNESNDPKLNQGDANFYEANLARNQRRRIFVHKYDGSGGDNYHVANFVVNRRGFLAWRVIQPTTALPYGSINVRDTHGIRAVDTGQPNEFSALQIHGDTVQWKKDGMPKSVLLG